MNGFGGSFGRRTFLTRLASFVTLVAAGKVTHAMRDRDGTDSENVAGYGKGMYGAGAYGAGAYGGDFNHADHLYIPAVLSKGA